MVEKSRAWIKGVRPWCFDFLQRFPICFKDPHCLLDRSITPPAVIHYDVFSLLLQGSHPLTGLWRSTENFPMTSGSHHTRCQLHYTHHIIRLQENVISIRRVLTRYLNIQRVWEYQSHFSMGSIPSFTQISSMNSSKEQLNTKQNTLLACIRTAFYSWTSGASTATLHLLSPQSHSPTSRGAWRTRSASPLFFRLSQASFDLLRCSVRKDSRDGDAVLTCGRRNVM